MPTCFQCQYFQKIKVYDPNLLNINFLCFAVTIKFLQFCESSSSEFSLDLYLTAANIIFLASFRSLTYLTLNPDLAFWFLISTLTDKNDAMLLIESLSRFLLDNIL